MLVAGWQKLHPWILENIHLEMLLSSKQEWQATGSNLEGLPGPALQPHALEEQIAMCVVRNSHEHVVEIVEDRADDQKQR